VHSTISAVEASRAAVVGEQIRVLAPGSRTGGYEIFRQAGPEVADLGRTTILGFYVVSGNVAFGVVDKDMIAEPGLWCTCRPARRTGSVTARRDDLHDLT